MQSVQSLPACRRCHGRKIRCDRREPACTNCLKASSACEFVDDASGEYLPRAAIARLEAREAELRLSLPTGDDAPHVEPAVYESTKGFVGSASGSSFLATMLSNPRWAHVKDSLLEQLRERQPVRAPEAKRAAFPSLLEARYYASVYVGGSHIYHPFLMEHEVYALIDRAYSEDSSKQQDPQDFFRLYMIFAIAAVSLQREKVPTQPPYNFFIAAQYYLANIDLLHTFDSVQNLLLYARFGIYFHISTSIWDIARTCMRTCVELEIHLQPQSPPVPLLEQHYRRVFWECYILDRFSSTTLARPFAIADKEITVSLPDPRTDAQISLLGKGQLSSLGSISTTGSYNNMSVFNFIIRLRKITSRIQATLSAASSRTTYARELSQYEIAGEVYSKVYELLDELTAWRQSGPYFPEPSSLYQMQQYYDFLHEKERSYTVRAAMDAFPASNGYAPPKEFTDLCAQSAARTILLYQQLLDAKNINCTRGYFQTLFTAGLSLIYCLSLEHRSLEGAITEVQEVVALHACADVLATLSDTLLDSRPYAYVFRHIKDNFIKELQNPRRGARYYSNNTSSRNSEYADGDQPAQHPNLTAQMHNEQTSLAHDPTLPLFSGLEGFDDSDWSLPAWSPSMDRLVADVGADVNQYAFGDWSLPVVLGSDPYMWTWEAYHLDHSTNAPST